MNPAQKMSKTREKEGADKEKTIAFCLDGMLWWGVSSGFFFLPQKERGRIVGSYNGNKVKLPQKQEEGNT